jgi:hypothetical protein
MDNYSPVWVWYSAGGLALAALLVFQWLHKKLPVQTRSGNNNGE